MGWRYIPPEGRTDASVSEYLQVSRDRLQAEGTDADTWDLDTGEESGIHCIRRQWFYSSFIAEGRGSYWVASTDVIRQPRQCAYYIKYEPGFGPDEHKELRREAQIRRVMIYAALGAATIGAGAAIIAEKLL